MMKMIDVMKRLAELDSNNPSIVKESQSVEECGMMPEIGMDMGAMERPSTPASINMTAGSGEELSDMLATIMQLAGVKQHGEEPMSAEPAMAITAEPEMDANADMRSVMDLMNPHDDEGGEEVDGIGGLDRDHDGDHDMGDHELEKDDEEEADEGQYDNSPASPIKPPMFNANKYAHQENQPGQGDRMDGDRPKAYADMNEATADLFAQYKNFISESNFDQSNSTEEVGQQMARDGITYSREKENEIIDLMAEYMKKAGMSSKSINRLINYDQDYVPDQLSYLPRVKDQGMMEVSGSVDFDKVLDAIAALYGDDMWDNDSMQDLANDLEQENPTDQELDFIIAKGKLPKRLANMQFSSGDDIKFGGRMMENGVSKFIVFYKDNTKRGTVVKTEVKASSPEEAESAFREWNSTNTPGSFSFVSAAPVNASMMEGKPSAGMSAKEKSSVVKKAKAGKDIGKPGKSFDKVASKAGGGEKGKKIAAAAMWKNAAKK